MKESLVIFIKKYFENNKFIYYYRLKKYKREHKKLKKFVSYI